MSENCHGTAIVENGNITLTWKEPCDENRILSLEEFHAKYPHMKIIVPLPEKS